MGCLHKVMGLAQEQSADQQARNLLSCLIRHDSAPYLKYLSVFKDMQFKY